MQIVKISYRQLEGFVILQKLKNILMLWVLRGIFRQYVSFADE